MGKSLLRKSELHRTAAILQFTCEEVVDRVNKGNLSDDCFQFYLAQYYRWLGIREFLGALSSRKLETFLRDIDSTAKFIMEKAEVQQNEEGH